MCVCVCVCVDVLVYSISCVECVDTEDACGWCVYGGSCSATSDPCPEPAGVSNTFLVVGLAESASVESLPFSLILSQLGDSAESADVCPVVNTASTPSGHYTQPVGVARNLTLMTSNLPQPVS